MLGWGQAKHLPTNCPIHPAFLAWLGMGAGGGGCLQVNPWEANGKEKVQWESVCPFPRQAVLSSPEWPAQSLPPVVILLEKLFGWSGSSSHKNLRFH